MLQKLQESRYIIYVRNFKYWWLCSICLASIYFCIRFGILFEKPRGFLTLAMIGIAFKQIPPWHAVIRAHENIRLFFRCGIGPLNRLCQRINIFWMIKIRRHSARRWLPFLLHQSAKKLIIRGRGSTPLHAQSDKKVNHSVQIRVLSVDYATLNSDLNAESVLFVPNGVEFSYTNTINDRFAFSLPLKYHRASISENQISKSVYSADALAKYMFYK